MMMMMTMMMMMMMMKAWTSGGTGRVSNIGIKGSFNITFYHQHLSARLLGWWVPSKSAINNEKKHSLYFHSIICMRVSVSNTFI